jgi:ABC-type branched-subunit amino acid transport system substrate-binding protein
MIPVATENKIPYYMLSAGTDTLTDPPATYNFRFGPANRQDAAAIADLLAQQGFKRPAIINNSLPFGTAGARGAVKALEAKGIKVITQQTYDAAATDVAPQVINAKQSEPDLILVYSYPADGARVARTIRQLGIKVPIVMPRVGIQASFLKLAGESADGILVPTSVDVSRPEVAKLYADYNAKYTPISPSPSPAQGYDAASLAVKVLSDTDVQKAIDGGNLATARKAIRDATIRLGQFQGMQGQQGAPYGFSASQHHGPPDQKFFVLTEVADKGTKFVAPDMNKIKQRD